MLQDGQAHFLQAGAIGLLRLHRDGLHGLVGREGVLGAQAELAVVQHSLPLVAHEPLLLAPQPLLEVADLQRLREGCMSLVPGGLGALLEPAWRPGLRRCCCPAPPIACPCARGSWPKVGHVEPGGEVDGWTLQAACPFGPPGRLFQALDEEGREALLWLAERDADEGLLATRVGAAAQRWRACPR